MGHFVMRDGLAAYVPDPPPVTPCGECNGRGFVAIGDWMDECIDYVPCICQGV